MKEIARDKLTELISFMDLDPNGIRQMVITPSFIRVEAYAVIYEEDGSFNFMSIDDEPAIETTFYKIT